VKKGILALMGIALIIMIITPGAKADDWEYWQSFSLTAPVSNKLSLGIGTAIFRFNHANDFYYTRIHLGGQYNLHPNFSLGAYYGYRRIERADGWHEENLFMFDAMPKTNLGNFTLDYRFRLGRSFTTSSFEVRNMVKLSHPVTINDREFTLFINNEIFYLTKTSQFAENRLFLGGNTKLTRGLSLELSYLLRSVRKEDDWNRFHIMVCTIKYSF
jgi:hypothetical protein